MAVGFKVDNTIDELELNQFATALNIDLQLPIGGNSGIEGRVGAFKLIFEVCNKFVLDNFLPPPLL